MSEIITTIQKDLKWLNDYGGNDLVKISKVLNHLSLHAVNLGEMVADAYGLMNTLEDEFKGSFAEFVKNFEGSVAKAEVAAEAEFKNKRKDWTDARNAYKRLSVFLDRLDRVLESHRQSLSIQKLEVKNI